VQRLREEFTPIYDQARLDHMLQPGDEERLAPDEIARKSNGRERVVYNTAVAAFGLQKLDSLLSNLYGEAEFAELFGKKFVEMHSLVYNRMDDAVKSTIAEYLKVLLALSDMSRLPSESPYALIDRQEFMMTDEGGFIFLHIAPRICYAKYRGWMRSQGQNPLFNGDGAFAHALHDAPQFSRTGSGTQRLSVDTLVFDNNALVTSGIPLFNGKPVAN
jgi:hypothetical protein